PDGPGPREQQAQHELAQYQPSFWDRLFGRTRKERTALEERVAAAREEDLTEYRIWQDRMALANRILDGDETAYVEAFDKMKPYADLAQLGSEFTCYPTDRRGLIAVEFLVQSQKVIPTEVKT